MRARAIVAALGLAALACAAERDPLSVFTSDGAGEIVVDGVLIVGRPLPAIRVSRTLSPDEPYSAASAAVNDAILWVASPVDTIDYLVDPGRPGTYVPTSRPAVAPRTTYRFQATVGADVVRAVTTTPPAFPVPEWVLLDETTLAVSRTFTPFGGATPDSVAYADNLVAHGQGLLEARFVRPDVPAFQVGLFSLDLDSDFAVDPELLSDEDFAELDRVEASPPLFASDGTIRLPWLAIYFQGRYLLKVFAVDRNWYDLVRSTPSLGGGSGFGENAGDGSDRPIFNVEGGIGLFGSGAVDSIGLTVTVAP